MSGIEYEELLGRVYERLIATPSTTDYLMLMRWRILSAAQFLIGDSNSAIEKASAIALNAFATDGNSVRSREALDALAALIRQSAAQAQTVLPGLTGAKRDAVTKRLEELASGGEAAVDRAIRVLPGVRSRVQATARALAMPGIRHRLALVEAILHDPVGSDQRKQSAAAAVLYVDDVDDVIPDALSVVGMLDDDYSLRACLSEVDGGQREAHLHWSERIASLWDDLPFLQGVDLRRGDTAIPVTWLDRVNSYVAYMHVLSATREPLVLLQPSVACVPLHTVVTLIGLAVLDTLTSAQKKARELQTGCFYELDDCTVSFEGVDAVRRPNWLRLRLRNDYFAYAPPDAVDRLVPTARTRLSSQKQFLAREQELTSPLQRFFHWDSGISPSSISRRIVLVTSQEDGLRMFDSVESNGVRLLGNGLVRFVSVSRGDLDARGAVLVVVPSLMEARQLADSDISIQAIVIDGYARLQRGRHELPFLMNHRDALSLVVWSPAGYYAEASQAWMPRNIKLEVSSDDLESILELDALDSDLNRASLWEAATGSRPYPFEVPVPPHERSLLSVIESYVRRARTNTALPDYWKYHLASLGRRLYSLVGATPADWHDIKSFAETWAASIEAKWLQSRPSARAALSELRTAEAEIREMINVIPDEMNSRGLGLKAFLQSGTRSSEPAGWKFVCERQEQLSAVRSLARRAEFERVGPVQLKDLEVCSACLVAGWSGGSFARRLWAHTPSFLVTITDRADTELWMQSAEHRDHHAGGRSLLESVGKPAPKTTSRLTPVASSDFREMIGVEAGPVDQVRSDELVPCVFLEVTGETEVKVLGRDSRVIVEGPTGIHERAAGALRGGERILLNPGFGRWSPAEEFTESVVAAVRASQPQLAEMAGEWRRALRALRDVLHVSTSQLRELLNEARIFREDQTIDGWLDADRASPIAPRGLERELDALWPLIKTHARFPMSSVVAACKRLRSLRVAASVALLQVWKGQDVSLDVDRAWLAEVVEALRQTVRAYELTSVALGVAPREVIGWWTEPAISSRFETDDAIASLDANDDEDGVDE